MGRKTSSSPEFFRMMGGMFVQFKAGTTLLIFFCAFAGISFAVAASNAPSHGEVLLSPENVVVKLPKDSGQEYIISSTPKPMKIIIDSNLPLEGFAPSLKISDVVLKELRYSQGKDGRSRLVLEFHYQVPEPVVYEGADFFHVEIAKTYANTTERMVIPGVIYGHQRRADIFGPNVVNYLVIDTQGTGIEVKLALAQNRVFGSEHVSAMGERLGAIAAVNGAFFASDGRPLGVVMIDGELISEPYANRTALGLGRDLLVMDGVSLQGEILRDDGSLVTTVTGLNRSRLQNELIIYTPHYGSHTKTNGFGHEVTVVDGVVTSVLAGNSPIPSNGVVLSGHGFNKEQLSSLTVGDPLQVRLQLTPPWIEAGIEQIIGGGPRLIRDGSLWLTGEAERFRDDVLKGRAPRTALGITADHKLLLVTVNGRQPNISVGMTLTELGNLLMELGAVQAMNLDGGGSTTMVIRNLVLNLPSDGRERSVSNAIVILPPQDR